MFKLGKHGIIHILVNAYVVERTSDIMRDESFQFSLKLSYLYAKYIRQCKCDHYCVKHLLLSPFACTVH